MAVTVAQLKAVLDVDVSGFNAKMKQAERTLQSNKKNMEEMASVTKRMSQSFSDMAGSIKLAMGAAVTSFVTQGVRKMVSSAADLGDSMSKVDTIFKASAESVKKWSENTDKALGLSQKQALDTAGTIGQLYQNMGIAEKASAQMSTKLIALAVDLAALNNIGTEEAMDRIKRGVRGSAEALDELGLSFNANMIKQKAYKLGLAEQGKALTEATKAQAIYALMMEQGAKVSGQFARESDTLAAQTKMLQAELDNLAAEIGKDLVPIVRDLVKWTRDDLLPELKKFGDWTVQIVKDIPVVVTELGKMVDPLGIVGGIAQRAADSFKALGESFGLFMHSIAMDASAMGKMQQHLQDASVLSSAAVELRGKGAGGFTFIPGDTAAAAKRYGDMPEFANNADYAKVFERAARRAREQADSAMASARVVRKMEAALADPNNPDFSMGRTRPGAGTPLPDLGTPTPTPQAKGTGTGKTRKGRSTFSAPGLDPNLTVGAFLPFGDLDALVQRGRAMYLEYLAFLEDRGKKAVTLVGGVTEQITGLVSSGLNTIFNDHTAKMEKRGKTALAITSEAATAATASLSGAVKAMWEATNKEVERQKSLHDEFMQDIAGVKRKRVSDQQSEPERMNGTQDMLTDVVRSARRSSRAFLKSLFGDSRDRQNVLKGFVNDLTDTLLDQLSKVSFEKALTPALKGLAENLGDGLSKAVTGVLKVAESSIGRMLGAVYQLLSALNRPKKIGVLSVLGGIAGGITGGIGGAVAGYNIGNALDNGDIGGAIIGGVTAGANGTFGGAGGGSGGGGNGLAPRNFNGNDYSGRSRSATINYNGPVYVNEKADIDRLARENVRRMNLALAAGPV